MRIASWRFGAFAVPGFWGLAPEPGSSRKLEEIDAWDLGGGDLMAGSGCRSLGGGDRSLGGGDRSLGGGDPVPGSDFWGPGPWLQGQDPRKNSRKSIPGANGA